MYNAGAPSSKVSKLAREATQYKVSTNSNLREVKAQIGKKPMKPKTDPNLQTPAMSNGKEKQGSSS
jgi:hypothetical protein